MSTVAPVIEPSVQPVSPPARGPAQSLRKFGKTFWALGDQVLISGTNFVTTVLVARSLSMPEFGAFSVIYGVLLLCNIIQSTLITQAHNVLAATLTGQAYRRYTGSTAVQQLMIVGIEAMLVAPLAIVGYFVVWTTTAML